MVRRALCAVLHTVCRTMRLLRNQSKNMKKWIAPCNLCRGKLQSVCMICGWKSASRKPELTKDELHEREGFRERTAFLTALSLGSLKAGNSSTEVEAVDDIIEQHREFAQEIYVEVRINGKKPDAVAKKHGLTKTHILRIVQHELIRQRSYISADNHPRPPMPPKPPPPKPAPPPPPRKPTFSDYEIVDDPD